MDNLIAFLKFYDNLWGVLSGNFFESALIKSYKVLQTPGAEASGSGPWEWFLARSLLIEKAKDQRIAMAVGGSGIKGDNNQSSWSQASRFAKSQYMFSNLAVALVVRFMNTCTNVCMYNLHQSSVPFCAFFFHKQGIYRYHYTMLLSFGSEAAQFLFWNVTLQIVIFDKRGWAKAWSDCVCLHGAQVGMPCSKHFNQFLPSSCIPHCRNVQKRNGFFSGSWIRGVIWCLNTKAQKLAPG